MRLQRYRPIVLLFLMVHVQACSSWQPATLSPNQVVVPGIGAQLVAALLLIEAEEPQEIRITRTNGEQMTLLGPEVQTDSIAGTEGGAPVRVGLSEIQQIEVKRSNTGDVVRLAFLGLVVMIGVSMVTLVEGDGNNCRYGRYCN